MLQGITVLTGTTSSQHMEEDLTAADVRLDESDVIAIENLMRI
jgi:hypothetical protein